MELSNEAMSAAGFSKPYTQEAFDKYDSGLYPNEYSNTDWIDKIYKSRAFQTGHNVSARGKRENRIFMSYGFLDQDGLVVGDGYSSKRHNARISVNTEVYDRLKLTGQMSYVDFYKRTWVIAARQEYSACHSVCLRYFPSCGKFLTRMAGWWIVRTGRTVRYVTLAGGL